MSPRKLALNHPPAIDAQIRRASLEFGMSVRDARRGKSMTVPELASRAGVSIAMVYRVEAGQSAANETRARLAFALGRQLRVGLVDPRSRRLERADLAVDIVHSAMGEFEARRLRQTGVRIGIDEPYQHFQFAGRADVIAWDLERRALLHIENRTRFPDFQEMAGAFNAKRAYLGPAIAARVGVDRWSSETHVIAALWSSEIIHALRIREASFRALCPDPAAALDAWWSGERDALRGRTSTLVILDPLAQGREREYIGLEGTARVRPRYRGYAEAVTALARAA